jgi:hypothetical protein
MARLTYDTDDLLRMQNLFHWRATYMVADAMIEARARAESYAAAGGRKRDPATRRYRSLRPLSQRRGRRATGNMIAWMAEKMFYRRFIDFWNPDW